MAYGNHDINGGIDRFWLDGGLRISPLEQIDFLERLMLGELPFRAEVSEAVADILVSEDGAEWTWSHKTGTALTVDPILGWLVGSTEHQVRQQLARQILVDAGALPSS